MCVAEIHYLESTLSLVLIWEESILCSCHHFHVLTAIQVIITIIRIIIKVKHALEDLVCLTSVTLQSVWLIF